MTETALSRLTRGLLQIITPTDAARRDLLDRAELPLACGSGPFSDGAARRIWWAAETLVGDEALGLHLAEASTMEDLGVLGYVARSSATFGEACMRAVQFERLFKEATEVTIEDDPAGMRLVDTPAAGQPLWPPQLAEAIMALWWIWPQRWTNASCVPAQVRFQHGPPRSTSEHQRLFGCPVVFEQPRNELVVPNDVWALRLIDADPLLGRYLEPVVEEELRRFRTEDPLLQRIRESLLRLMPSGATDAGRIARAVGLSRRSLHRRLAERGLTYQGLVDELRRQTALRLFESGQHSFVEISFLVGFSDASSLRRAYRRWSRQE